MGFESAGAHMKVLMQRSDGPATRDTLIWFAAPIVTEGEIRGYHDGLRLRLGRSC